MLKNHIRINGQLLQTNKKWNHLKAKQKAWIMETAKREYDHFVQDVYKRQPYNVAYQSADGKSIQNDSMADSKFYEFLLAAFKNMAAHLARLLYTSRCV